MPDPRARANLEAVLLPAAVIVAVLALVAVAGLLVASFLADPKVRAAREAWEGF